MYLYRLHIAIVLYHVVVDTVATKYGAFGVVHRVGGGAGSVTLNEVPTKI